MQVRAHSKKIQLVEVQLQFDPTNKHVRVILSISQGKVAELFQTLVERFNHTWRPNGLSTVTLAPSYSLTSIVLTRRGPS